MRPGSASAPRTGAAGSAASPAKSVVGGGMDLWFCDHDHAPGVRDCRELTPAQRAEAADCAAAWIAGRITSGALFPMPVTRDDL
jgi:hypothetical protein